MKINTKLVDRKNSFYWQTDRDVTPQEAGEIWADRHKYFADDQIITSVNRELESDKIISLKPLDYNAQTSLGNVNSVRTGTTESGKEVIIRNHPTGIENGYFHSESLASQIVKDNGVKSYSTFAIHDLQDYEDHSFQVIEKLPGVALKNWLLEKPEDEDKLLFEAGKELAQINKIKVKGFGPFNNKKAKEGDLVGVHDTYESAVTAGLDFNCEVLQDEEFLSEEQVQKIKDLYIENELLKIDQGYLIHNDFADWNLLTDGEKITGVIDFDECVSGDFISEIACWSTFFKPERLEKMLAGYWSVTEKPDDFEERFQLLRLRYILSKMTLRVRRYSWEPSEFMKGMIDTGKVHLDELLDFYSI